MATKNPYLKKANAQHEYTKTQIVELQKCMNDPIYFIDTYCQIQHAVHGSIPFKLRPYQTRLLNTFSNNRLSIVLAARQIGKSWIAGAYLLWFATFYKEKTVVIASNKNDNAQEMIHRIKFIYERLPHWLKSGVTDDGWNKHSVGFENGSRIISQATSENTGRGLSISLLFLDEFAFVRDSIAEEFWTSISPTLATGGSCIICSTPNGDTNRYAQLWRGATTPSPSNPNVGINGFASCEVAWDEPPGRDEAFKEAEIAKIGEVRWRQEYLCEFLSSDPLLIDSVVLARMAKIVETVKPIRSIGDIQIYKDIRPQKTYIIGMDAATGSGSDYAAIVAYEFPSMEQVLEFRSNTTSSVVSYHMLKKILKMFDVQQATAFFSVENNGVGEAIIALFEADDNPPESAEFVSESGQKRAGMTTTGKSKIQGCIMFKEMLERDELKIASKTLVAEAKNFVRSKGSYSAKTGATDDVIMATIIAIRVLSEMSSYDSEAFDKLYKHAFLEDSSSEYDNNEEPLPFIM